VSGGIRGRLQFDVKKSGSVWYFDDEATAMQEAERLNKERNVAGARAHFSYVPKLVEEAMEHSLDNIRKGLKGIMSRAQKVDSQEAYDKFLKGFGDHAEVVDSHVNPDSIDKTADSLHYHQKDPKVSEFLKKHVMESVDEELAAWKSGKTESASPLGARFLQRITEADEGPKLDTAWKGLYNRMKRPYEKKIIELFAAIGLPGRLIVNEEGIMEGIQAGGDVIRRPGRKQSLFNKFFDAYTGKGAAPAPVAEAKKRGGRMQKILESVLVRLGMPESLTTTDGNGALGTYFNRAGNKIEADSDLQAILVQFAKALGVTSTEVNEAYAELDDDVLAEDVDVGNDEFFQNVIQLCLALGVPEKNLQFQRPNLIKSLRAKKQSLSARGMIESRMAGLMQLVQKYTRAQPQAQQQDQAVKPGTASQPTNESKILAEAFSPLEALTSADLKNFNAMEPQAGPAMMAAYEGGGAHEETILMLAVDPDAEDDAKSLRVGIDGPWDGTLHNKYFQNNKDGYKAAIDYANMLRTANLKTGGRPKGWKG
jgi:hypothetical protein